MTNRRYSVPPLIDDDVVLSESDLLTVLLELHRMGRLADTTTVHVYEEQSEGRTFKGTVQASSVLTAGGVDEKQFRP